MKRKLWKIVYNIRIGKPEVAPDTPSHVKGVREGNKPGSLEKEEGIIWKDDPAHPDTGGKNRGGMAVATARRSTGITPENSEPIDPAMPNLTPP